MDISTILKGVRQSKGLSRRQVARDLGLNYSTLYRLEEGKTEPTLENLVSLARYYDLSLDNIFLSKIVS